VLLRPEWTRYLRHFGIEPQVHIPGTASSRAYGPNIAAIDRLIDNGAKLLLTPRLRHGQR